MWPSKDHRWVAADGIGIAHQVQHIHASCARCIVRQANSKGQEGCQRLGCPADSRSLYPGFPMWIRGIVGNPLPKRLLGIHRTGFHTPRPGGMNQKHKSHSHQATDHQGHDSPFRPARRILLQVHRGSKRLVRRTAQRRSHCSRQATFRLGRCSRTKLLAGKVRCKDSTRQKRRR